MEGDIKIEITYMAKDPTKYSVKTDVEKKDLEDILSDWLKRQLGQRRDKREPHDREVYSITIDFSSKDDTFVTSNNIGNTCLVRDAILGVLKDLDNIELESLQKSAA